MNNMFMNSMLDNGYAEKLLKRRLKARYGTYHTMVCSIKISWKDPCGLGLLCKVPRFGSK